MAEVLNEASGATELYSLIQEFLSRRQCLLSQDYQVINSGDCFLFNMHALYCLTRTVEC